MNTLSLNIIIFIFGCFSIGLIGGKKSCLDCLKDVAENRGTKAVCGHLADASDCVGRRNCTEDFIKLVTAEKQLCAHIYLNKNNTKVAECWEKHFHPESCEVSSGMDCLLTTQDVSKINAIFDEVLESLKWEEVICRVHSHIPNTCWSAKIDECKKQYNKFKGYDYEGVCKEAETAKRCVKELAFTCNSTEAASWFTIDLEETIQLCKDDYYKVGNCYPNTANECLTKIDDSVFCDETLFTAVNCLYRKRLHCTGKRVQDIVDIEEKLLCEYCPPDCGTHV